MSETKKPVWRLKDPSMVFTSKWGRVDHTTPSELLGGMLRKCPELSTYIVEDGVIETPKANVVIKKVGETQMVKPAVFEIELKEEEPKEVKPKKEKAVKAKK
jgi:hypothetical protein